MNLPIPGIYSVPDNPTLFVYFAGKTDEVRLKWFTYYFLTDDPKTSRRRYTKTACTIDSSRYDPAYLITPCKSFAKAKRIFTKENYPEYFI